ncbi:hypothetical protein BC629DRAFT_1526317 [Irpex lacteus]|nr:hypothetical protein BC629DRAFT_1526317 [Irpex lacteus]
MEAAVMADSTKSTAPGRIIWVSGYPKLWTSNIGEFSVRTSARCLSLRSDNAIEPYISTPPGTRYSRTFQANGSAAMKEIRCRFEWDIVFSVSTPHSVQETAFYALSPARSLCCLSLRLSALLRCTPAPKITNVQPVSAPFDVIREAFERSV